MPAIRAVESVLFASLCQSTPIKVKTKFCLAPKCLLLALMTPFGVLQRGCTFITFLILYFKRCNIYMRSTAFCYFSLYFFSTPPPPYFSSQLKDEFAYICGQLIQKRA